MFVYKQRTPRFEVYFCIINTYLLINLMPSSPERNLTDPEKESNACVARRASFSPMILQFVLFRSTILTSEEIF